MDKKQAEQLTDELLLANALIRVKALERLLISKGIISEQEIKDENKEITDDIMSILLKIINSRKTTKTPDHSNEN